MRQAVVGFVVAGGQSRRMGRDKALLPWEEGTLLGHALERLRRVTDDVRILCGPTPRYESHGAPVVPDTVADQGALGGVFSGLSALDRPLGLFLAVDLPAVPVALLEALVAGAPGFDAVVPVSSRGPEPLCAVYSLACLEPIRQRLAAGEAKMTSFWPDVRVRAWGPADIAPFGEPDALFANLNHPEDYALRWP
ncbi:MAG TPA: molybdenum cofactor guanylyltransferase [Vicinamibacteria bacterium]